MAMVKLECFYTTLEPTIMNELFIEGTKSLGFRWTFDEETGYYLLQNNKLPYGVECVEELFQISSMFSDVRIVGGHEYVIVLRPED